MEKHFKTFFYAYYLPVLRFVCRYVEDEAEAGDISQEVFLSVSQKWEEFDGEDNARAFLYTAARNLSLDHLKHRKVESHFIRSSLENPQEEYTFLKEVTRQEVFRILYAAIDRLPAQTRQVILYTLEGCSVREVGERMNISSNTVKTLKKNGYSTLRQLLPKEYLDILFLLLQNPIL